MSNKILVTCASRAGSTAGVAEAIAKTLTEKGASVDLRPVAEVTDPGAYQAVVIGSAIQGGRWLPEAMQFIQAQRTTLAQVPCAAFLVCMTQAMKNGENYRSHVANWMQPARALLNPVSEGLFAGALDIRKIPSLADRLKFRLSVLFGVWPEGDQRDWGKIRAWAESVYPLLNLPTP